MAIVRREARCLTASDGVAFVLREQDRVHYADEDAIGPLWKGQRFPLSSCISGQCILNRQAIVVEDVYQDPRVPHELYRQTFVKSMAAMPIRSDDPIGAIAVYWAEHHLASPEEVEILQTLADASALAIANVRLYQDLQAARMKAESANAAKTRFLAAASHDLRQPLQAALLFEGMLAGRAGDAMARDITGKLHQALENMGGILKALLDISRLEAGIVEPKPEEVSVQELFRVLEASFAPAARQAGVDIHWRTCGMTLLTDHALVAQIVHQLVDNAIHYAPGGRVLVACRNSGTMARLQVWDTGIGIPEEQKMAIFEEFHQIDNPARDRSKGLGLGLAIVRRLADLLGLQVSVRSRLGRGSVFEVAVPSVAHPATPPSDSRTVPVVTQARIILVIEDDPLMLDALRIFIGQLGFEVIAAAALEDALEALTSRKVEPDLVLADFRLAHGAVGTEAIARVRATFGHPIPGILLTGDTSPDRLRDARASGLGLLHKPVQPEDLAKQISDRTSSGGVAAIG